MGLRCSLLGHTFVEEDVTRERQDRGSEVLTITREIERCRRCGAERVVSENTEVTAVGSAEESGASAGAGSGTGPGAGVGGGQPGGTRGSGADVAGGGGADDQSGFSDVPVDPPDDPAEDDAEILTEEEERQPGQWPDEDEPPQTDSGGPEPAGTGGAGSAGGGEIIDAEESADTAGDEAANEPDDEITHEQPADTRDQTPEPGPGSTMESSEPDEESKFEPVGSSVTVPEGHYECSGCGFRVDAESSFRDGDVCPECREAYLEYQG